MKIALVIILAVVVLVLFVLFNPWVAMYVGILLQPDPPVPEITYGEFPFRLDYTIEGKHIVVVDTLICRYDGVKSNVGVGKYVAWEEGLASGRDRITLLTVSDSLEIYYPVGHARYYMGYFDPDVRYEHVFPGAARIKRRGGMTADGLISAEELAEKYSILLTNWEPSAPIVNRPGPSR